MTHTIYTDGSCLGNPGKGGWAFIYIHDDGVTSYSGSNPSTTNNIMELTAIIEGLKYISSLPDVQKIEIYSDSKYCIDGITKWINKWVQNNWKTSSNNKVKNENLWKELYEYTSNLSVEFHHVKAHNGDKYNTMVDNLAQNAATNCFST
mgnify:CR=1 FL=1|uniref:ribonuclease H n=1 Tax=viral metagenome TaxID=1070528 RepID=A0A6C0F814_9ZZZZ|tara:strand:+ start:14621 stop:15067 length:447 start_codon:yes stop_codon:yes gene_type:complete